MRRKLLTFCSAVSLLILFASVVGWARSYWAGWSLSVRTADSGVEGASLKFLEGASSRGGVMVAVVTRAPRPRPPRGGEHRAWRNEWDNRYRELPRVGPSRIDSVGSRPPPRLRFAGRAGFGWFAGPLSGLEGIFHYRVVVFPWWLVTLGSIVPPALAYWRWRVRRIAAHGNRCTACGYDLRATPDRCPECGTAGKVTTSS